MPRSAKHIASVSLGVMGAGFLAALPFQSYSLGMLIQGGFEAGLVGGLADWFAVTALFRHPLGIPIPHTALLPRNRERVVQALISAIENEFLTKESIRQKVSQIRVGEKLLSLLEEHVEEAAKLAVRLSEEVVRNMPLDRIVPLIENELQQRIRGLDSAAVLGKVQEEIVSRGYEKSALLFVLEKVEGIVRKEKFRSELGTLAQGALENVQMGGFMGFAVSAFAGFMSEDKLGSMLQNIILTSLKDMRLNDGNSIRNLILDEIRQVLTTLPENGKVLQELDQLKDGLPQRLNLEEKLHGWLSEAQDQVLDFIRQDRFADEFVKPMLVKLIADLKANKESLDKFDQWLHTQVGKLVEDNHSRIGKMVKENLDKLDNNTLIEMMEERIGKDLQWIRVNGALCGFLIGVALQAIQMVF